MTFPLPKAYFIALFCEAILHGIFTVLTGGALYLLFRKRRRYTKRTSLTNMVMVFLTVAMYSLATVHIALSLRQNLIAFFDQHAADGNLSILNDQGNPIVYTQIAIEVVNCLIGDSIVCWRAWVLWGRDFRIMIPAIVFVVGGTASGIGVVHAFSVSPPGEQVYNNDITNWVMAYGGLTCAANLYCVGAISYKAWTSAKTMRQYNKDVTINGGRYHSAVLIIVESGALYCVALIITVALFAIDNNGVYVIADMIGHLTGIYPTVIIVLVCLKMTVHDDVTRAEMTLSTMQCQPQIDSTTITTNARSHRVGRENIAEQAIKGAGKNDTGLSRVDAYVLEPMAFAETSTQDLAGTSVTKSGSGTIMCNSVLHRCQWSKVWSLGHTD